jgi:peroxiredoxin
MLASACLLAWTLVASQGPPTPLLPWGPRLERGQELVYRGSFTEETSKRGTKLTKRFQIENRILVLETLPTGINVAVLTITEVKTNKSMKPDSDHRAVHLQRGRVNLKGRINLDCGEWLPIQQQGPPEIETGCFVELPPTKTGSASEWAVAEASGPCHWRMTGAEAVEGQASIKLLGSQQSEDWDHPIVGRTAWRRQDTVWLSPQTGIAVRYERVVEGREATSPEPVQRAMARFQLESSLIYPGQLFRDREAEINLYRQYSQLAETFFRAPSPDSPRRLGALAAKITFHCHTQPPTPFREALQVLQNRLESASRGDLPPVPSDKEMVGPASRRASTGATSAGETPVLPAPDFVATDMSTGAPVRLQSLRGRPVLLLFFHPRSTSVIEALRFAQMIAQTTSVSVLGLSVTDEAGLVFQERDLKLTFPLIKAAALRSAYGVDSTPKIILLDSAGSIRRTFEGWGEETPSLVREELIALQQQD